MKRISKQVAAIALVVALSLGLVAAQSDRAVLADGEFERSAAGDNLRHSFGNVYSVATLFPGGR